eukprot:Nitzschia sp. Nitz4//scaffold214_size40253//22877//25123//NITZ4_007589-RA/size40253-augustus-gene-0.65-mRNA-1//1//CDS//3329542105//3971//frame0
MNPNNQTTTKTRSTNGEALEIPETTEFDPPEDLHLKVDGDHQQDHAEKKLATMSATNPGAMHMTDKHTLGTHDKKDDSGVSIIDVSTPSQSRRSDATLVGPPPIDQNKEERFHVLPPSPVHSSSLSVPPVPIETRSQYDTSTLVSAQSPPESAPMIVAAEIVDQGEHDRMATEIAELQARLRVQENQDVIQAVPMGDVEKAGPEQVDGKNNSSSNQEEKRKQRRRWWILFGMVLIGGIVASEIKLPACELSGTLPSELLLLQHLETLSLAENYLSGSLPTQLAELSQLKYIRLDYNMLSGPLPPILPATMRWLSFADNAINGTMPSDWGNTLSNLMAFDGWGNSLSGTIPTEWGNLDQFEHLDISSNWMNGTIPSFIGSMTHLQFLSLSANLLSGSLPSEIGNLSDLTSFDVSSNHQLGGAIPSECGNLHYVKYFELGRNQFSGPIPTTFGTMYNLVELYLDGNQLSGSLPTEIGELDFMLTYIHIHDNPLLTGTVPSEYGRMSTLQWFSLYNTSLSGSLDSMFCDENDGTPTLSADCLGETPEVECSCCYYCCSYEGCEWM